MIAWFRVLALLVLAMQPAVEVAFAASPKPAPAAKASQPATEAQAAKPAGEPEERSLYQFARSLKMLQDQIAAGYGNSIEAVPALLTHFGSELSRQPPEAWKDRRNVSALCIYLSSGGAYAPVRRLLSEKVDFGADADLVHALLAFAENRPTASELLAKIDARTLPASMAGAVALVQAISSAADAKKGFAYLELARLLAPGTLIEEGALRREIQMRVDAKMADAALQVAERYLWRFRNSVYAPGVADYLVKTALATMELKPTNIGRVRRIVRLLPKPITASGWVDLARQALLDGRLDWARLVLEFAGAATEPQNADHRPRLAAYLAILQATTGTRDVDTLRTIDRRILSSVDRGLVDAAISVARGIGAGFAPAGEQSEPTEIMKRVVASLELADASLVESLR